MRSVVALLAIGLAFAPAQNPGRRAEAERILNHVSKLTPAEENRLIALGDDAVPPMIAALRKASDAYERRHQDDEHSYDDVHKLWRLLDKIVKPRHAPQLIASLEPAGKDTFAKAATLELLTKVGDPKVIMPYFIREIDRAKTPGFEMYESATYISRTYVMESGDPQATEFKLRILSNPHADPTLKNQSYTHVAMSGDPRAVAAVLAHRTARRPLRPLAERALKGWVGAGEFGAKPKLLAEKTDAAGRRWGLFQSGALGDVGDLWLAEKIDGTWTNPRFLGVSTSKISGFVKPKPPEAKIAGMTAAELIKGDWVALARNSEVTRDADGDGLTDLAERRLGSDPQRADSDRDGDRDEIDPWPNVSRRPETDAERLLAAAFEARFHESESDGASVFTSPQGVRSFEMPGRMGPTLWVTGQDSHWEVPLSQRYEHGVGLIGFQEIDESAKGVDRLIQWNKDHTVGKVLISVYYGGLNGTGYNLTVRKFGKEWIVVAMKMAYIS